MPTKMEKERLKKDVQSEDISFYEDDLTLARITQMFNDFENKLTEQGYTLVEPPHLHEYSYYGDSQYYLLAKRWETDDEYELRMSDIKAMEGKKRQTKKNEALKERQLYEKLKEKFEPKEKAGN